jgi:hypothetical protein
MNMTCLFILAILIETPIARDRYDGMKVVRLRETVARTAVDPAALINHATSLVSAVLSGTDGIAYAGKGSRSSKRKARKAVNPWPTTDFDDQLLNLIMCCIGIVVCVILAIIAYRNGW